MADPTKDPTEWYRAYRGDDPVYEAYLERVRTGKLHGYEIQRLGGKRHPATGEKLHPGHTRGPEWEGLKKEARKRKFWGTLREMYGVEVSLPPELPLFPGVTPPGMPSTAPGRGFAPPELPAPIARALEIMGITPPPLPPVTPEEGAGIERRLKSSPFEPGRRPYTPMPSGWPEYMRGLEEGRRKLPPGERYGPQAPLRAPRLEAMPRPFTPMPPKWPEYMRGLRPAVKPPLRPTARPAVMGLAPQPTPEEQRKTLRETLRGIWESLPIRTVRGAIGAGITGLTQVGYAAERAMGELDIRLPFGWKSGIAQVEITREQLKEARGEEAQNLGRLLTTFDEPTREKVTHSIARISHSGLTGQYPAAQKIGALVQQEPDISPHDPRITEILREHESPLLEMIGNIAFDPLNLVGLGLDEWAKMRLGGATRAQFATRAADDVADVVGDVPKAKPLIEALNPLAETRSSQARSAAVNTYDVVQNVVADIDEPGDIVRILTQWGADPTQLAPELGVGPQSPAGRIAQRLLKDVDVSKFETVKPDKFTRLNFLVELDEKVSDVADVVYSVKADRLPGVFGDYQNLVQGFKNYASDVYLGTNPGYVWRNAYNNFVTTAVDGVQSFDRAEDVAKFYERLGVKLLRAEEGIGSAELFRGAKDIRRLPLILRPFRRLGNVGHGIATGQLPFIGEGWYRLRANTVATRRFLGRYWRFGKGIPEIPENIISKLDPETVTMLQRGIEQGMNRDEFLKAILRVVDDTPGISVSKYLDDVEDVSPGLLKRVQSIVDDYDVNRFAGQIDALINDVREWETRAWKFEGWARLPDGSWAYDAGPFNMQDTPYLFSEQAGELANKVGLHLEGKHYLRRVRDIARELGLPGAEEITRWADLPAEGKLRFWNRLVGDAGRKGIPLPGYIYEFDEGAEIRQMVVKMGRPRADGRGISYGDAVMASTEKELEFLGRVFGEVPGEVGAAKGPAGVRGGLLGYLNRTLMPAWKDMRLVGLKYGEEMADFALLNYNKRRNIDTWLSMLYPYHYWYTRSGRNWAVRSFTKPWAVTSFARYRNTIEKLNEELPTRLRRSLVIPAPDLLPEWMGNELFVDVSRAIWPFLNVWPYSQLLSYNWADPDEEKGALEQIWNLQRNFQMRPYVFFDLARTLTSPAESQARREFYYFVPQTAGIKGTSAVLRELFPQLLEGVIPPGGWNIEEGVRERLGLPRQSWPEEPYWSHMAISEMAAEGEITYEEGLEALQDAVIHGNTDNPIYQRALQRAGARKGTAQMTSFWLGQPVHVYPTGERIRRGVAGELREAGWAPERPEGTKAARTEIYEEYPEYGLVAPAREAALGEVEPLERAVRYEEYNTQREAIESVYGPLKEKLLKKGIGPGMYGYEVVDDMQGQASAELSEAFPGLFQPRSLYGASPQEVVAEYQRRLLNALSSAYYFIEPKRFADAEGGIDWDAFYAAREEFKTNPPIEAVTGPEQWPYAGTVTPEMFEQYLLRNDTPEEAIVRVLSQEVYRPVANVVFDPDATQAQREAAKAEARKVDKEVLIQRAMAMHPNWAEEEVKAMRRYKLPTFNQWQRSSQNPQKAMVSALRDFYFSLDKATRKTLYDRTFAQKEGVPQNYLGDDFRKFILTEDAWKKTKNLTEVQLAGWLRAMGVAAGLARGEGVPVPGAELPEELEALPGYREARVEEPEIVAPTPTPLPTAEEEGGITGVSPAASAEYDEYVRDIAEYQRIKETQGKDAANEWVRTRPRTQELFDKYIAQTPERKAQSDFWSTYRDGLPPGTLTAEIRNHPDVQFVLNPKTRETATAHDYERASAVINAWLEKHPELQNMGSPEEYQFARDVAGYCMQFPEGSRDRRECWRFYKSHPEFGPIIEKYYPSRTSGGRPPGMASMIPWEGEEQHWRLPPPEPAPGISTARDREFTAILGHLPEWLKGIKSTDPIGKAIVQWEYGPKQTDEELRTWWEAIPEERRQQVLAEFEAIDRTRPEPEVWEIETGFFRALQGAVGFETPTPRGFKGFRPEEPEARTQGRGGVGTKPDRGRGSRIRSWETFVRVAGPEIADDLIASWRGGGPLSQHAEGYLRSLHKKHGGGKFNAWLGQLRKLREG